MKPNTCLWAMLTILMVLIALFFGLMPREWPIANDIQRLTDERGIRFKKTSIAYVDDLHTVWPDIQPWPLTIEMAVTAGIEKRGFSPLLVMHDGVDRRQLAIWQYGTSLIVMNGDDYSSKERRPRIVGRDVLSPQRTSYFTITSGEHGTLLYVDGMFAAGNSSWKLAMPVEGGDQMRLVLGHSVYGKYAWMGDLHGLAISGKALSEDAVMRRFERWAKDRNFDFLKQESTMLLFTFADTNGDSFVDESGRNLTLVLPEHMTVLKKTFLSPPWRHLNWSHVASVDAVVNVVGFIPLGVVLYGFLQGFSGQFNKHKGLLAVIVCMFLSLGIELSQAWIPTRYSTQLDLILNTFGAWLGIVGWKLIHRVKEKRINPV